MRTGAIFARGSCRALKWVAACMMAMALGAGQAHAQTIDAGEATFTPRTNTVMITPGGLWGTENDDAKEAVMADFTVNVRPATGDPVAQTITSISVGTWSSPSSTITLTLSAELPSGADVELTYAPPTTDPTGDADDERLRSATTITEFLGAVTDQDVHELDVPPVAPSVDDLSLAKGKDMTPTYLPAGSGGNGDLSYDLFIGANEWDNANTDGTAKVLGLTWDEDARLLYGNPTTAAETTLIYRTTDEGLTAGRTTGTGQSIDTSFKITVRDGPAPPPGGTTTLTGATLTIDANNQREGTVQDVRVTLSAEVPANTVTWTSVRATIMAKSLEDAAALLALAATGEDAVTPADDGDFTVTDPDTSNADPTMSTVRFVFDPNRTNDSRRQTITRMFQLQTLNTDRDAEDEGLRLSHDGTVNAVSLTSATQTHTAARPTANVTLKATQKDIKIEDAQTQTYTLTGTGGTEGGTATLRLKAVPLHVQGGTTMSLSVSADPAPANGSYTITSPVTVGKQSDDSVDNDVAVVLTAPANDGNRVGDTVTVTMASGTSSNPMRWGAPEFTTADLHTLPTVKAVEIDANGSVLSSPSDMIIEGGAALRYKLTITKALTEDIKVALEAGGDADAEDLGDYTLLQSIAIDEGETESDPFTLTAVQNDDVGPETLVLTAEVSGEAMYGTMPGAPHDVVTLTIDDTTMKLVEPNPKSERDQAVADAMADGAGDDGLNPDPEESFAIPGTALFTTATGYTAAYSATSSDSGVATVGVEGGSVTVTAKKAGSTTITVSATASMGSSANTTASQTVADRAEVTIPVEVKDKTLVVMVDADPMEIMEGGMSTLTATANRKITAGDGEVMIGLEVVGDGTLDSDSIMIDAGMMSGSAMLTATEDDDYDDETVTVVASGSGIKDPIHVAIAVMDNDDAPEPTNVITAKSSDEIYPMLMEAGLAGDDAMFNPGMMAELDASKMFVVMDGYSATYAAESDAMNVASPSTMGSMVTVTAGEAGMAHVTITGTATMASGVMTGQPATNVATVMFPVNVVDMALTVTVSTDPMDMVEEGGMITVTAMANRMVLADEEVMVTLTITGAVEMNEMTIEIAAGMDSGMATVQVLDDTEVAPMADITIVATGSGIATAQTFTISVTENDSARTFTLSAPEDMMNLVEGGDGVELTVTADPAVSVDTEVMIMVDRSASTAGADDFTAEPVMISAGETSGTTMLMATEDDMPDSGHASPEMLVVFAMADNTQSNTVSFYIWDMSVPALPLIAQLLLAAFLAIGGYRRYLRR